MKVLSVEENNKNEMIESYGIQIMSPLLTNGSTEQDMLWALRNLSDKDWIQHFLDLRNFQIVIKC